MEAIEAASENQLKAMSVTSAIAQSSAACRDLAKSIGEMHEQIVVCQQRALTGNTLKQAEWVIWRHCRENKDSMESEVQLRTVHEIISGAITKVQHRCDDLARENAKLRGANRVLREKVALGDLLADKHKALNKKYQESKKTTSASNQKAQQHQKQHHKLRNEANALREKLNDANEMIAKHTVVEAKQPITEVKEDVSEHGGSHGESVPESNGHPTGDTGQGND